MKKQLLLPAICALFLLSTGNFRVQACMLARADTSAQTIAAQFPRTERPGFFARIKSAVKTPARVMRAWGRQDGEKAGLLSKIALYTFFGSYALAAVANNFPVLAWVVLGGMIAGFLLALIVLWTEVNPRSRKLARVVVITGLIVAALVALVIWLLSLVIPL